MASIRTITLSSGRIVYAILWRDPDTRRQTSFRVDTIGEAQNFKRLLEENGGHLAPTQSLLDSIKRKVPTVAEAIETHIAGLSSATARSRADYQRDAKNHINPYIGWRPIDQVTIAHVNDWLREIAATSISDKTIANVHGLLSAAMNTAAEAKLIASNPCRGRKLPRRSTRDNKVFLSPEEWDILDEEIGRQLDGYHQLFFRTLAGTGMRWGEAVALRVGDLRLNGRQPSVTISRASRRDEKSRAYVGPTKTKKSERTITLSTEIADLLREHVKGRPNNELVFTSRTGAPVHHSNVRSRVWVPAIKAAQDRERHPLDALTVTPRIHDLRHSHASWVIGAGVDLMTVQRRMGHENITTTTNVYGHLMVGPQAAAAEAISAAMFGRRQTT